MTIAVSISGQSGPNIVATTGDLVSVAVSAPSSPTSLAVTPAGTPGGQGPRGDQGPPGPANSLAIGTVSAAPDGTASATITGTSPSQMLNLTLPRGPQGATGNTGPAGTAGRSVELQTASSYVQWRLMGDTAWQNLVALSAITGPQGRDGSIVEFRSTSTYLQWRYQGDTTWMNLIPLASITGPQGVAGAANVLTIGEVLPSSDGTAAATITGTSPNQVLNLTLPRGLAGTPARNIELQASSTALQWRLAGDTAWTDLVPLTSITGPQGLSGLNGTAATIQIGTVSTGAADSSPTVTNTGTSTAAILNFVIPRGSQGSTGSQGQPGPAGPANTLTIGDVSGGDTAAAYLTGTAPNQTLSLVLPKGDAGPQGPQGPRGAAGGISLGLVLALS